MSSLELSSEFELRQKMCWSFKSKIQQAMKSSLNSPLTGTIHVDEFMVRGPEEDKRGRSRGLKKLIVLAVEILDDGKNFKELHIHIMNIKERNTLDPIDCAHQYLAVLHLRKH